jgi:hypothetical protein
VEAICATGQSLKNHSFLDDYIGEKGFGFKKVFSVAHKVHIQSGIWSFSFKHQRGDDGLGMVTPLITEPAPLPAGVTTRITLTFTDTTPRGYTKLLEAVEDLPVSTIFFLQKIEKITIRSFGLSSHTEKVEEIEKERSLFNRDVKIRQRVTTFDGSAKVSDETKNHTYRVFSQDLSLMPENDARRGRTRAKVELAFPYDAHTNQPKLSERGQHVFAHLPLHILPQIQVSDHESKCKPCH